jgi:hypothetical protein
MLTTQKLKVPPVPHGRRHRCISFDEPECSKHTTSLHPTLSTSPSACSMDSWLLLGHALQPALRLAKPHDCTRAQLSNCAAAYASAATLARAQHPPNNSYLSMRCSQRSASA